MSCPVNWTWFHFMSPFDDEEDKSAGETQTQHLIHFHFTFSPVILHQIKSVVQSLFHFRSSSFFFRTTFDVLLTEIMLFFMWRTGWFTRVLYNRSRGPLLEDSFRFSFNFLSYYSTTPVQLLRTSYIRLRKKVKNERCRSGLSSRQSC